MKTALYIDACIRKEDSRTKQLADAFFLELDKEYEVNHIDLAKEDFKPLINQRFIERQKLLEENKLNDKFFDRAHELADADLVVIAAPFWDLSFPSIVKIYIENCSVDGITFTSTEDGLKGLCKANNLIYFTSRGGIYHNKQEEQATPYLKEITKFFGIKNFNYVDADGMDIVGYDSKGSLEKAINEAKKLARSI